MDPANGIIIEEYDFQGMMVFGQATNWAPFRVSYCPIFIIWQYQEFFCVKHTHFAKTFIFKSNFRNYQKVVILARN